MRSRALATTLLILVACQREGEPTENPEPAPTEAPAPAATLEAEPEPEPGERVVATVDGRPLLEKDVERQLKLVGQGASRPDVIINLVDRLVLDAEAARQSIRVHEDELAAATESVAQSNGLTLDALKLAVLEQTGMTWAEYEDEVRGQIIQMKVLQMLGVDMSQGALSVEQQSRVMLCLRARSETEIHDDTVKLPPNPYDLEVKVTGLTVQGKPALDSKVLESAVLEGVEAGPACEVLIAVEPILQETYFNAGYVRAEVELQWPLQPEPEIVLTVVANAGELHRIGAIHFDQSQVPVDKRADEATLRELVGIELKAGDVASMSRMKAARDRLGILMKVMSLPQPLAETQFDDSKSGVLDLTFVVPAG